MQDKAKVKHVPSECVLTIPKNVTSVISCHSCKEKRIRKLKKGIAEKAFTAYEKGMIVPNKI